jgi:hypothetical protein
MRFCFLSLVFSLLLAPNLPAQSLGMGMRFAPDSIWGGLRLLDISAQRYGDAQTFIPGDRITIIDGMTVGKRTPQQWRDFFKQQDSSTISLIFNRFGLLDTLVLARQGVAPKTDWLSYTEPSMVLPDLCGLLSSLVATRARDFSTFMGRPYGEGSPWRYAKIGCSAAERVLFRVQKQPGLHREVVEAHIHISTYADSAVAWLVGKELARQLAHCEANEGVQFRAEKDARGGIVLIPIRVQAKAAYEEEAREEETLFLVEIRVVRATEETTGVPWLKKAYALEIVVE